MQDAMITHLNLTAQEIRPLRKLARHRPFGSGSRREGHQTGENARNTDRPQKDIFRRSCSEFDSVLSLLLEGKALSRDWLNPRAIVAVGEHESFAHVPQVGTRWQIGNQQGIDNQRISVFRQLWCAVFSILLPTVAHREFCLYWRDFVIPYPPTPFAFRSITDPLLHANQISSPSL